MSLTLTISGKSSLLAANYFRAIDLSDGDYELVLLHGDNSNNSNYNTDDDDDGEGAEYPITIRANYNTMRCEIRCAYRINFGKPVLSMLRALESGRYLSMSFRSWDLYEYPLLQNTTKHSWAVKTATQLEKPRYVIFALQTGRKNVMSQNGSV
ncbi:hypothetical protein ALC57_01227 [Trachymyrmex cornetzi]|uniref:Double jelly roll-like domain-containing protein n=1 Tax=Trachymyrmex cornetzi TaxID=471704 RepID=A0A151JQ14_9HYME|nr:hypothetical protein ALC57_01227 [Trachymyrmex cornetzi]